MEKRLLKMSIKPGEISGYWKKRLKSSTTAPRSSRWTGYSSRRWDRKSIGLDDVMISELVEFPNGTQGMVLNLETDKSA